MPQLLKVLIVEDSHDDAERLVAELRRAGFDPDWHRVDTEEEYLERLQDGLNLVLSHHQTPRFSGLRALELLRQGGLDVPFILVSDTAGEDIAVTAMRQGATDYLIKNRLDRLGESVSQALESVRVRAERKRVEQQLLLQGTALATVDNAILITDAKGIILWVNAAFTALTGYAAAEAVGQTPRLLKSGKHEPGFYKDLWTTVLAGKTWRSCITNRRKDGSLYFDEQTITPVRSKEGVITHFVTVMNNVTERRSAEEALGRHQRELSVLFDLMPAMIWFKDTKNRILRVNQRAAHASGRSVKELEGVSMHEIFPKDADKFYEDDLEIIRSGKPKLGIIQALRDQEGNAVWVQTDKVPVCDQEEKTVGIFVMAQDITERKLAEDSLLRFRALVDQSNDILEIIDPETGRYLDVNDRGCAAHGYTREEFLALRVMDINSTISVGDWPQIREEIRLKGLRSGEGRHRRQDGTTFPIEFSSKWVKLERDYIVSMVRDITERKATEEHLLHSQRIENIGMLAAGVAHDLNNILAPMLMVASILESHMTDEADRRMVQMVETSAKRGAALVRQILGFAHGVGGEQQLVQVKHLLNDIASIIQETFPKQLAFEQELSGDLWTIQGNPTQLHQVLLNLCINARDAMPHGGTLKLAAENCLLDPSAARLIDGASPGKWLKLSVSDNGTGIPPEVLARIWDPFFTTKGPGKGSGLGLSTVRGIVERHHGFITVDTAPGRGTGFSVYFPAAEGKVGTTAPMAAAGQGNGELVLVVDDEESIRSITTDILIQHNYRPLIAADAVDGIALIAKHILEISVVITDFNMPGLNGETFARVIRSMNPEIKIIGMSGGDEGRLAAAKPNSYADAFLVKPFHGKMLLRHIQELLKPIPAKT